MHFHILLRVWKQQVKMFLVCINTYFTDNGIFEEYNMHMQTYFVENFIKLICSFS